VVIEDRREQGRPGHSAPAAGDEAPRRRVGILVMVAALLLVAAFALRVGYVAATPDYAIIRDARDYDRHARSLAMGEGFARIGSGPTGRTAFRPPAYPFLLAGVYKITGTERASADDRAVAGRVANALIGTAIVALVAALGLMIFDRRVALVAAALGAVYLPLVLAGGALMSEPLFAALMLGALVCVLHYRDSAPRYRWVVLAGVLAGLTILARPNAIVLLAPLAVGVWIGRPRFAWRSLAAPLALVLVAAVTVLPWSIRNAEVMDGFVPLSTQLGSALAGTYNDQARADRVNPASWRSVDRIPAFQHLVGKPRRFRQPEAQIEKELRSYARSYALHHPGYVVKVAYWNTRRMLDLASLRWSRHTAATISIPARWADAGVVCFWVFAVLALIGAFTPLARRMPGFVVAVPVLMYLSVVFLVVETPRYRTGIDPFIVLLAAVALVSAWDWGRAQTPQGRRRGGQPASKSAMTSSASMNASSRPA
jgi:4-amino-4-deoxy-L-arabinose transferase-like glycosyltransferase